MGIKLIPIFNYPFLNTQNQIKYDKLFEQKTPASMVKAESVSYVFNYQLGGLSSFDFTDRDLIDPHTPNIKVSSLGSLTMTINISPENFSSLIYTKAGSVYTLKDGLTMANLSFIYFYNEDTTRAINKYFYYVEDIIQVSTNLWRVTLSLDVMKTYNDAINDLETVKPLRYFQPVEEYFDMGDPDAQYGNRHFLDPLINYPTNPTIKMLLSHYMLNEGTVTTPSDEDDRDGKYTTTGLWDYFYLTFSGDDDTGERNTWRYRDTSYYIIALPHNIGSVWIETGSGSTWTDITSNVKTLRGILSKSPYLLKIITSDIPPFNRSETYASGILLHNVFVTVDDNGDHITHIRHDLGVWTASGFKDLYSTSEYLHVFNQEKEPSPSGVWLPSLEDLIPSSLDYGYFMFYVIKDNNPNNIERDNELVAFSTELKTSTGLSVLRPILYIPSDGGTEAQRKRLTGLMQKYDIGYVDNSKLPINLDMVNRQSTYIELKFTSYIVHDLNETHEIITVYECDDSEYYVRRASELSGTQVKDDYYNYLYLNQNALRMRDEAKRFNDTQAILSAGVGLASTIALTGVTGGAFAPVAIGAGVGSFNVVRNLASNELSMRRHRADLEDKALTPLKFEPSNFNAQRGLKHYLPVLSAYRDLKGLTSIEDSFRDSITDHNSITKTIENYGFYTPLSTLDSFEDIFVREHYNFIQLRDVDKLSNNKLIPNEHFRAITKILENGVRYYSVTMLTSDVNNEEV
jgi:hypothetical protein